MMPIAQDSKGNDAVQGGSLPKHATAWYLCGLPPPAGLVVTSCISRPSGWETLTRPSGLTRPQLGTRTGVGGMHNLDHTAVAGQEGMESIVRHALHVFPIFRMFATNFVSSVGCPTHVVPSLR